MSSSDRCSTTENYLVAGSLSYGQMDYTHQGSKNGKELVVLDVRNHYETRIGRFQLKDDNGVLLPTIIDPHTRQVLSSIL